MYKHHKSFIRCGHEKTFLLQYYQYIQRSIYALLFCLPTSLLALLTLLLLTYNCFSMFCIHIPFLAKTWSSSSPSMHSSLVIYAAKEENSPMLSNTHLPLMQNQHFPNFSTNSSLIVKRKKIRRRKLISRYLPRGIQSKKFSSRVKKFFKNSTCNVRFFMTWISSLNSFGNRELFTIESLFKSHPRACLVIVSSAMDSRKGNQVLLPFLDKGFHVITVSPDFDYLFKNTHAEAWFNRLKKGRVNPGGISLGQNLSNLLRLSLLYKFGGVYIDSDVIVLKSFEKLRNTIGAQAMDIKTENWSRLNNAVLVFDKNHPLLYKFIQEFALTFDGNKWGHNGPYLVSRVVQRVSGKNGFNFTVLPPDAFYPVDWSRIESLFHGPRDFLHSKWLNSKLRHIRSQSYAVHLWNRQSRNIEVENGSIISHIMLDCCIFCSSSVNIGQE